MQSEVELSAGQSHAVEASLLRRGVLGFLTLDTKVPGQFKRTIYHNKCLADVV